MRIITVTIYRSRSINIVGERWTVQSSSSAMCTIACNSSVSAEVSVTTRPSKSESTESPVASS